MIGALLKLFLVGLLAVVGLGIALAVVGAVFGLALSLAGILLFKVLPLVLIGYIVLRLIAPKRPQLSKADQEWLES
jgi:hypothetical protein